MKDEERISQGGEDTEQQEEFSEGGSVESKKGRDSITPVLSLKGIALNVVATLRAALSALRRFWASAGRFYRAIFRVEGEATVSDDIRGAFSHLPLKRRGMGLILAAGVLLVYLGSGIYTVKPGEQAVVKLFGQEVRRAAAGLRYRLPWPVEAVEKVDVMDIRRVGIGVQLPEQAPLFPRRGLEKAEFLTGDENIVEVKLVLQYQIKDASEYLFNVESPDRLIERVARAATTELFGGMRVDDLLTASKAQIQRMIGVGTQRMLDDYGTGLLIAAVTLQGADPPKEVAGAFRDVASAREEREERINKAQGYRNNIIPEAKGKAYQMVRDAEGYREEVINRAQGEAQEFLEMLTQYQKAREVTEYRLYLETMEKVLARTKHFIVDSKNERVNLKFIKP